MDTSPSGQARGSRLTGCGVNHWVTPTRVYVPVLEIDHEETVADLEGVARRLVAWCGLEWEPACLSYPSFGSGSGISRMTSFSGPPNPVQRIARMGSPPTALLEQGQTLRSHHQGKSMAVIRFDNPRDRRCGRPAERTAGQESLLPTGGGRRA
jgi:hypothetical protein